MLNSTNNLDASQMGPAGLHAFIKAFELLSDRISNVQHDLSLVRESLVQIARVDVRRT